MKQVLAALRDGWTWRMAWRDARSRRRQLALFAASMTLGVAALVAVASFADNLRAVVATEAKGILGADLRVRRNSLMDEELRAAVYAALGDVESTRQLSFASMASFNPDGAAETRLVQVRALDGAYPYYGDVETVPADAHATFRQSGGALVDDGLMLQFDLEPGDTVKIGRRSYEITGALTKFPGQTGANAYFGPRIYVPLETLDEELLSRGSRVTEALYAHMPDEPDTARFVEPIENLTDDESLRATTIDDAEDAWSRSVERLDAFLGLVGFVALLLGGLGVGSAIHVHVRRSLADLATLRCLGATEARTVALVTAQVLGLGLAAALVGSALGVAIQTIMPSVLADFLPVDVPVAFAPRAVALGLVIGVSSALLFALLPLADVSRIPPLAALRATVDASDLATRRRARAPLAIAVVLGIAGFASIQAHSITVGLGFTAGIALVFVVLSLIARGLMTLLRQLVPSSWSYVWRQALANLHRPYNQTTSLMVALGLGAFLVLTMVQTERILLAQVDMSAVGTQPNLVMFDIQDHQRDDVAAMIESNGLPLMDMVPIVTMRIASVAGRSVSELRDDESVDTPSWQLTREYRSTFRSELTDTEEIVAGAWTGRVEPGTARPPISLEADIAESLGVGVGDEIVFDVQGVAIPTVIGSLRAVEWRRVQPNFFAVFPEGVLDAAPKFHVAVTRADSRDASALLQREAVRRFPNVSSIDLATILEVADEILGRVAFVIRFMAAFSILTGLVVLAASLIASRDQRIEESVLLRTLGAVRAQVTAITRIELVLLGLLATGAGAVLSIAGSWALSRFVFETPFVLAAGPWFTAVAVLCAVTTLVGSLQTRGLHERPPLEVLRQEA